MTANLCNFLGEPQKKRKQLVFWTNRRTPPPSRDLVQENGKKRENLGQSWDNSQARGGGAGSKGVLNKVKKTVGLVKRYIPKQYSAFRQNSQHWAHSVHTRTVENISQICNIFATLKQSKYKWCCCWCDAFCARFHCQTQMIIFKVGLSEPHRVGQAREVRTCVWFPGADSLVSSSSSSLVPSCKGRPP